MLATVPVGYGDGWRRATTDCADVAIGGRRYAQVGTVSMDNMTVDVGPDGGGVAVGDEVVLVGGPISAEEVARRSGTINYEATTALLPRATKRCITHERRTRRRPRRAARAARVGRRRRCP